MYIHADDLKYTLLRLRLRGEKQEVLAFVAEKVEKS
jgi:hypothetical protein